MPNGRSWSVTSSLDQPGPSGLDVPLLAGVVELGPLANRGPVGGFAVLRVQDHAVGDVADGVVAARGGDVPFLAQVAERGPQVGEGAVPGPAVHGVEDLTALDVGDDVAAAARAGERPLLAGGVERGQLDARAVGGAADRRGHVRAAVDVGGGVRAAGRREAGAYLLVADRDDVGLDGVVGCVGRVAGGDDTFEEGPVGLVAVVAAGAQDDGALLVHRGVSADIRKRPVVFGGQAARLRVGVLDRVCRRAVVLQHGGHERAGVALVARVGAVAPGEEPILHVRLVPGPGPGTGREPALGAEVDRIHVAIAVVGA